MELNENQIEFMLNHFFEDDYNIFKCFDTCDRDWIKNQRIELKPNNYGWHNVLVNGETKTSINTRYLQTDFYRMLEIE